MVRYEAITLLAVSLFASPPADEVERRIAELRHESVVVRSLAAIALAKAKDPRAVDPLVVALGDARIEVRVEAAHALGAIRDPRAVEPLLEVLGSPTVATQVAAVEALGRIGDPRTIKDLLPLLGTTVRTSSVSQESFNSKLRSAAVGALAEIGPPVVDPLLAILKDEQSQVPKEPVLQILGGVRDVRSVQALIAVLPDKEVRYAGVRALSAIGPLAVDSLVSTLGDPQCADPCWIMRALAAIGDVRAVDPLVAQLENDWRSDCAVKALSDLARAATEPLIAALSAKKQKVRASVAEALCARHDPRTVEAVRRALKDQRLSVEGATTLAQMCDAAVGAEAAAFVREAVKSRDPQVRVAAVEAHVRDDVAGQAERRIEALRDKDPLVREAAARALHDARETNAVKALVTALTDESFAVRSAAEDSITKLGQAALDPLRAACAAGHASACRLLGRLYEGGRGLSADKQEAARAYLRACDGGDEDGCFRWAEALFFGDGVERDAARALHVFSASCERGHQRSCVSLGNLYYKGEGAPRDWERAAALFQKACDTGVLSGCLDLGLLLERGHGVAHDRARAVELLINALGADQQRVRRQAETALVAIGSEAVDPLLSALSSPTSASRRQQAARILGQVKDPRAVEPLVSALSDTDSDVRIEARDALVEIGAPAVEPLMRTLRSPGAQAPRHGAALALGKIKDPRAIAPLIEALKGSAPTAPYETEYARALGQLGAVTVEPLIDALADRRTYVRYGAADALGLTKDPRAIEPLVAALGDQEYNVRVAAHIALQGMKALAVDSLVRGLHNGNARARAESAGLLAELGESRTVAPLVEALKDQEEEVRKQAAKALGHLKDPLAVRPLIAALEAPGSGNAVADALGQLGASAVEPLISALEQGNERVRGFAADALGHIKDPRAVRPLIAALGDSAGRLHGVVPALDRLGEPALEPLLAALADPNETVRKRAAKTLGYCGTSGRCEQSALDRLVASSKHQDWRVRAGVAEALGDTGAQQCRDALVFLLDDPRVEVRRAAAVAVVNLVVPIIDRASLPERALGFGVLRGTRTIPVLIDALRNGSEAARSEASGALGRIGSPATDALVAALRDDDRYLREEAAKILDDTKDPQAVEPLVAALNDPVEDVRDAVVDALKSIDQPAIPPLVEASRRGDAAIRQRAVATLAELDHETATAALIEALRDLDANVRVAAANALRHTRDPRAVEPLARALADPHLSYDADEALHSIGDAAVDHIRAAIQDRSPEERALAAQALGHVGAQCGPDVVKAPSCLELLVGALHDSHAPVRLAAASALESLRDLRTIEPLIGAASDADAGVRAAAVESVRSLLYEKDYPGAIDLFLRSCGDGDPRVRAVGARGLSGSKDPRARPALIAALKDESWEVRRAACSALGADGRPAQMEMLVQALRDVRSAIRAEAAAELRGFAIEEDAHAVESLIAALSDQAEAVRGAAMQALNHQDARLVEPLVAALDAKEARVRQSVIELLGKQGDSRAVKPLLAMLRDPDNGVRDAVVLALGRLGAPAVEPLIDLVGKGRELERIGAARALGALKDVRALDTLVAVLKDTSPEVRGRAAEALGQIRDARATEPLIALLKDRDSLVRARAAGALVASESQLPVSPFMAALSDEDAEVRRWIAQGLSTVKLSELTAPLEKAFRDPSPAVRFWIARTISTISTSGARAMIIDALSRKDVPAIAGGLPVLLTIAPYGSDELFAQAIEGYADRELIRAVWSCGNKRIENVAGRWWGRWRQAHGYLEDSVVAP